MEQIQYVMPEDPLEDYVPQSHKENVPFIKARKNAVVKKIPKFRDCRPLQARLKCFSKMIGSGSLLTYTGRIHIYLDFTDQYNSKYIQENCNWVVIFFSHKGIKSQNKTRFYHPKQNFSSSHFMKGTVFQYQKLGKK